MGTTLTRRFAALPLGRQLGLVVVLSLLPAVALMLWTAVETLQDWREDVARQVTTIAVSQAAFVGRSLDDIDLMADSVTRAPFVQALEPVDTQLMVNRLALPRTDVLGIVLLDPSGAQVARYQRPGGVLPEAPYDGARQAMATGRRAVEFVDGPGAVQFAIWFPVDATAGGTAAMGFFMNLEGLQAILGSLPLPADSFVSLADGDGRIVAHGTNQAIVGQVTPSWRGPGEDEPRVDMARMGQDGIERIGIEVSVPGHPFALRAGIPSAAATAGAWTIVGRNLAVVVAGLIVWLGVAFVLARRFTLSVGHLDRAAQRIASGDLGPVALRPMPSRELADLQDAFATMVDRLNASRQALDRQMQEERRMRREVQSLQSQVVRQERLAAVGQLVSGVAHEINNPLQAILGFAELIRGEPGLPESVRKDVDLIQRESHRACTIVRNLAVFARQQPDEVQVVPLSEVVRAVAELRQHRMVVNDIEFSIDDAARHPVRAVATELQQVVLNFVVNAEQAIESAAAGAHRITIRTRDEDGSVVLEVEDTGPGVDPADEPKLFEPFFTTKPVGQGTGLGLSVSYGIIDSMGGRLGYRRAPGGGAIFYFALPAVEQVGAEGGREQGAGGSPVA